MLIGNFPCKAGTNEYTPPMDWPSIDGCPDGHIQLILNDTTLATYAFLCFTTAGQYSINWGDGTTTLHDSGATAQHTYTVGTGQACSRGYTTFVADISPVDAGAGLTRFRVTHHSLATQGQYWGILGCIMNCATLTDLSSAFYLSQLLCNTLEFVKVMQANSVISAPSMFAYCYSLQSVDISSMVNVTNTTSMFAYCYSLQSVDVSSMVNVTDASNMFYYCYSLQSVDVSSMVNVTDARYMFAYCYSLQSVDASSMSDVTSVAGMFMNCYSLQSVDISSMVNVTNTTSMFAYCYSLQSVDVSSMVNVTDASSMFTNCCSLQNIVNSSSLGSNATTTSFFSTFPSCEQLISVVLPNTKISRISINGASGKLNKLTSLTFSPLSLFEGSSPQITVSYCSFDATQLNALSTSLPTLSGKTISIMGCPGAATCNRSIATAKGWTVTG